MNIALKTNRLILKSVALPDLDDIFALCSDQEVMKYVENDFVKTKEEVIDFIKCQQGYFEKYGLDYFSVFEKDSGEFVGQAGLFHLCLDVNLPDIEIGYRLHKKHWNKGYATELVTALIQYGFNQLLLPKIIAAVDPENKSSRKVLEKCGMSYIGTTEFRGCLLARYEIYRSDGQS